MRKNEYAEFVLTVGKQHNCSIGDVITLGGYQNIWWKRVWNRLTGKPNYKNFSYVVTEVLSATTIRVKPWTEVNSEQPDWREL